MRSSETRRRSGAPLRLAPIMSLALGTLLLGTTGAVPAEAAHAARLILTASVTCQGRSLNAQAQVKNDGSQPAVLTQSLFYVYTRMKGRTAWNKPTVFDLLANQDGPPPPGQAPHTVTLASGDQKGRVASFMLVPGVDDVVGILVVQVKGEPFIRSAFSSDYCR